MSADPPGEGEERHRAVASIRRADIRFLSPEPVYSAAVLGDLPEWRDSLSRAGLSLLDHGERPADLVVAEGRGAWRALETAGYSPSRYVLRPRAEDPTLLLALEHRAATRYAIRRATSAAHGWRRGRNAVAAELLGRGVVPPGLRPLTVGFQSGGPPRILGAGAELGVPPDAPWFLTLGRGDQLSRNAFHLFEQGERSPSWVLKFVRVPGYAEPFERDEQGLALAAAEPLAAAHAPRLVGRFQVDGIEASLETAAAGQTLQRLLQGGFRRGRHLDRLELVAGWIVDLGARTRASGQALEPEKARLIQEVLPAWSKLGVERRLVDSLPEIPAVLQHNDLGCWNIVVENGSFVALDWESARGHGFPLWDLVYFLTDALAALERVEAERWDEFVLSLYRGESSTSPFLFTWIRRAVEAAAVPPEAVGTIVSLGWMHHGLSHLARGAALARQEALGYASPPAIERIAGLWLTENGLGPAWRRWQDL